MARINLAARQIHCKIVYAGPGMAGKTTNLQYLHQHTPTAAKSDLFATATATERTVFFHFLPSAFVQVRDFELRFHVFTVPGCILYPQTRLKVLEGVDGVVFVADSHPHKWVENRTRLHELVTALTAQQKVLPAFPLVVQYNKRDAAGALPIAQMDHALNPYQMPRFEAVATAGVGVVETLDRLAKMIVRRL